MDYAFIANGYHYHTRRDDVAHFDRGSIQHSGDNTVAFLRHIGNNSLVADPGGHFLSPLLSILVLAHPYSPLILLTTSFTLSSYLQHLH